MPQFEQRYGEIDLSEHEASRRGGILFGALAVVLLLIAAAVTVPLLSRLTSPASDATPAIELTNVVSPTAPILLETNTPAPTPVMATVTPPPPTPMPTSTPGPCTRVVSPGDDLISIIFNCGHRSLDVMTQVLELNNLSSPELIQLGQEILVPWPTPTPDPNAAADVAAVPTIDETLNPGAALLASLPDPNEDSSDRTFATQTPFILPTETLLPGMMYHVVQPNESMAAIAYIYRTNAETLSQLNPEIAFSQCDFGLDTGGPTCIVFLVAGQQIRVPAPTPTPTLSPTLSGSETPTPTYTPTYNAPSLISPPDRTFFLRNELITLRWVGTGVLAEDELYVVTVKDLSTEAVFEAQTRDLFLLVPESWQSTAVQPHDYQWSVGVVRTSELDNPRYVTDPRLFTWEGRAETS